jgi:Fur family transcriptional regulator, ferric uptake regulator
MVDELSIFNDFLKLENMYFTQPRKTILRVFLQINSHTEIKELYKKIEKEDGIIGIATVYRTMNLLVECGLASKTILSGDKIYFEKRHGREHHDHFICTQCERIEEFHHPLIEESQNEIARQHSFAVTSHRMTLFGTCHNCK